MRFFSGLKVFEDFFIYSKIKSLRDISGLRLYRFMDLQVYGFAGLRVYVFIDL